MHVILGEKLNTVILITKPFNLRERPHTCKMRSQKGNEAISKRDSQPQECMTSRLKPTRNKNINYSFLIPLTGPTISFIRKEKHVSCVVIFTTVQTILIQSRQENGIFTVVLLCETYLHEEAIINILSFLDFTFPGVLRGKNVILKLMMLSLLSMQ